MPDRDKREEYLREFQEGEVLLDFDQKVDRFFVLNEGVLSAHLPDGRTVSLQSPTPISPPCSASSATPASPGSLQQSPAASTSFPLR